MLYRAPMNTTRTASILGLLICGLFATLGFAQSFLPPCPASRDPQLWELMNRAIMIAYEEDPITIGPLLGDESRNTQLGDVSATAIARRLAAKQTLLDELKAMDHAGFSDADETDSALLIYQWESDLRLAEFKSWQMPISTLDGPQVWLPQMGDRVPMRTEQHRKDYLVRLKRVPILIGDQMDNMRQGIAEGRVPPKVIIEPTIAQALAQASIDYREHPTLSPFYKPLAGLDVNDPISIEAKKIIRERIIPVYQELAIFLQNEYLPACRDTIGASQGIDGMPYYNALIAKHTTMPDLTADQIHELGLSEVKRIKSVMQLIIDQQDPAIFTGRHPPETTRFDIFVNFLRTDPRFYYTNPDDLLDGYKVIAKTIDAELPALFSELPSLPYGVKPLPAFAAESAPAAFYYPGSWETGRPGNFMANLSMLDQRPKYEMIALTLHEAVPGHHLQISLAQEIKDQHPIRKTMGFTGFVEGWALYAEKLGLAMGDGDFGLYSDPYDNFGRLNFEMWRALRLVVDTGIHAKGWTREQAIEYMRTNSALSEHNIEAEVNRYIGWPGQATGYKVGELAILALRTKSEAELREKFDLRAFHREVLRDGAIPLLVLDKKISRWIKAQQLTD